MSRVGRLPPVVIIIITIIAMLILMISLREDWKKIANMSYGEK